MDKGDIKKEIAIELENLERLVNEMEELTGRFSNEPDFIQTRAAGSILHDFYSGVENLFEKIAVNIDGELPEGDDWHKELLSQMGRSFEGIRGAVINEDLLGKLKEFLRFRHLFRNIYGFELKWNRFEKLSRSLSGILIELKANLDALKDTLNI